MFLIKEALITEIEYQLLVKVSLKYTMSRTVKVIVLIGRTRIKETAL